MDPKWIESFVAYLQLSQVIIWDHTARVYNQCKWASSSSPSFTGRRAKSHEQGGLLTKYWKVRRTLYAIKVRRERPSHVSWHVSITVSGWAMHFFCSSPASLPLHEAHSPPQGEHSPCPATWSCQRCPEAILFWVITGSRPLNKDIIEVLHVEQQDYVQITSIIIYRVEMKPGGDVTWFQSLHFTWHFLTRF